MIIQKTYSVGIYVRLSKDDERNGESVSIENQKLLLSKYVAEQPTWNLYETYADDGWSGTNFERPAFQRMLSDAKEGVINLIIVKDLSRFGRNYIEIGQFTDYIFPAIGCRFVALHDNVDTIRNDNDIMAYKNLFNEFHSRDTSKKVRTMRKASAERGKFMGSKAPYGFKKDPDNKHRLIIDEPAAAVVRKIFDMRCKGMGFYAIASQLNNEQVPPPSESFYANKGQKNKLDDHMLWSHAVVMRLMQNEAYIGNLVQGKIGTISFKNRKLVNKPKDEWIRAEQTHEPIIEKSVWDRVHEINAKKHKPRTRVNGESNMFVGLMFCAECGSPMRYQGRRDKRKDGSYNEINSFLCGKYSRSGKGACTAHIIRENALHDIVVEDIRTKARLVSVNEQKVVKEITRLKNTESANHLIAYKKEMKKTAARITELEKFIRSLYEDKVKGVVPESLFTSMMTGYEQERLIKTESLETLKSRIEAAEQDWKDVSLWTGMIKKYTDIEKLDASILLELINRVEISHQDIGGERVCEIRIYYRFVEQIDLHALEQEAAYEQAI